MAIEEHLEILKQGVEAWNQWREENPEIEPNLGLADLRGVKLIGANLRKVGLYNADLTGAILTEADLYKANLTGAVLTEADLNKASLFRADLTGAVLHQAGLREAYLHGADLFRAKLAGASLFEANLFRANLYGASLAEANLRGADLTEANLSEVDFGEADLAGAYLIGAQLRKTKLRGANLTGCHVYGVSAWDLQLEEARQLDLVITPLNEPNVTVDNLDLAQFIYLLLNNEKIRDVIITLTAKAVLLLGRFTPERKAILDAIREELRNYDLLPILFDFDKPPTRDIHETITILARLSRFVIADITDPRSLPQELVSIVEQLPSLPVQPILHEDGEPWGMYDHIRRYPWVLTIHCYKDLDDLLTSLRDKVIAPAEAKAEELERS